MKKVAFLVLFFTCFTLVSSQNKYFNVGTVVGPPVKTNSLLYVHNDDYMNSPEGQEKQFSINYGVFASIAPSFLNKKRQFKNYIELKYGITNRNIDWKHEETAVFYLTEVYYYKHFNTYKQQNYNVSIGLKHFETFGNFNLSLGCDIQYMNYQSVNHKLGFNYWDSAGKWTGYRNIEQNLPSGYSVGLNSNIGLLYALSSTFSVGCQLNFGIYSTKIKGALTYDEVFYYWDSWNWVTKKITSVSEVDRSLINTSPIIPEIRMVWNFNHKRNICSQPNEALPLP
jgi:hypothetical protein